MDVIKGLVVKSISGHDKDFFYAVVGFDGNYSLIADGKYRKVEKPKRKSLKHLRMTNTVIDMDNLTNKKLRNVLLGFQKGEVLTTHKS